MNGVQEVESSNLSTQTRNSPIFLEKSGFFVLEILCGLQRMSLCCQHGCQQIYLHGCQQSAVLWLLVGIKKLAVALGDDDHGGGVAEIPVDPDGIAGDQREG